jgi:predicted nucleic acid-binding protein
MSRVLVDTGPLIQYLRRHQPTVRLLRVLGSTERLTISVITRLEIFAGMHEEERYGTQKFLARFLMYDLERAVAETAGDLIARYRQQGQAIGVPDAIIAATALRYQLPLLTFNTQDFAFISGLRLYPALS